MFLKQIEGFLNLHLEPFYLAFVSWYDKALNSNVRLAICLKFHSIKLKLLTKILSYVPVSKHAIRTCFNAKMYRYFNRWLKISVFNVSIQHEIYLTLEMLQLKFIAVKNVSTRRNNEVNEMEQKQVKNWF